MDSGTSGSMQSSSGGDEEYDSRAESSLSAFLNNPPPLPQTHPNPQQQQQHTHLFDPLSNYLDPIQRSPTLPNPNSLLNLDMMWSKVVRSDPNQPDLSCMIPCSSSPQNQSILSGQLVGQTRGLDVGAFPTTHHFLPQQSGSRGLLSVSAANDQVHNTTNTNIITNTNNNMVRNPKKRSRASRRAPTTVLTTDTTNFRAMVQEFTGIPAPPFTSSTFPRTRLDLFGSVATSLTRSTSSHLDPPPPPYLLRPFAQKVQPPHPFPHSTSSTPSSFPPSSSMVDTLASSNSTSSSTNSTSINYQLSSPSVVDHLGLLKQQQPLNVNNMHNPILNFQSILQGQAPPRYPLGNSSLVAPKTQPSLEIPPSGVDSHIKMGVLEELGLSHAHVNTHVGGLHQNMMHSSSDGALSRVNNNNNMRNPSAEWAQRTGTFTNNDGDHGGVLRSLSGTGNYGSNIQERVLNGKVNYSASPSDFHGEKGPDCAVVARSEGMVESWINCSSD